MFQKIFKPSQNINLFPKCQFSSKIILPHLENFEYSPEYLKDPQYLRYLKSLSRPPLNLFWKTSKKIEKPKFFSNYFLQKLLMTEENSKIQELYYNFLKSFEGNNENFFKKTLELKYYNTLRDFLDKFQASSFTFEVFEPKKLVFELFLLENQTYEGVFIERGLNYGKTEYFVKESYFLDVKKFIFSGKTSNLMERNKNSLIHDEEIKQENIEDLRKSYKLQYLLAKIQTNLKLNIWDKNGQNLIFGSEDENLIETRYVQIEHKFADNGNVKKKFLITDVDNILQGNPHTQ